MGIGRIRKVCALHPVTRRVIREFASVTEAAEFFKMTTGAVSHAAKKFRICKGYRLSYRDGYVEPTSKRGEYVYKIYS